MFRHVALFRFRPGTTPEQVAAIADALGALPAQIPEVRDYRVGPDAGVDAGNFDFAVVADFDDAQGYAAYAGHPAHEAVGAAHVRPVLAERSAVQYEC